MEAAGHDHTVLITSDGQAVAWGECPASLKSKDTVEKCKIPPLDEGVSYTQACAGQNHTVLLRSDGQAVACGSNAGGECSIPLLDEGLFYTQVSAGSECTVLLRNDGQAVACGSNFFGKCDIPPPDEGLFYTQVSAGLNHTVLLRSDGHAVACGSKSSRKCDIPPLDEGLSYTQVSAGSDHTVLLRSDGQAVACGSRFCRIPHLDDGKFYTHISAGCKHNVFLRSDGKYESTGPIGLGMLPPDLDAWSCAPNRRNRNLSFVCHAPMLRKDHIVQIDFVCQDDVVILTCFRLDGHEALCLKATRSDRAEDVYKRVARGLNSGPGLQNIRMILPDGRFFASLCQADPFATVSDVLQIRNEKSVA